MKKFGIIGNPIKHSLSPVLHNYWFEKYNVNASYSIIEVVESELDGVIKKIKNRDLNGINITKDYLWIYLRGSKESFFNNYIKN